MEGGARVRAQLIRATLDTTERPRAKANTGRGGANRAFDNLLKRGGLKEE